MLPKSTSSTLRIGQKAAQTNYYADEQARRIGLPINLRVTINFALLGVRPEDATRLFQKLRSMRFAKWVARPRRGFGPAVAPAYYYGFENRRDGVAYYEVGPDLPHNTHVHWGVHVPQRRISGFGACLRGWVDELAGASDWPENAIKIDDLTFGRPATYTNKGAAEGIAIRYGVPPDKVCDQGVIIGRRSGTSRNIGPKRRRAADAAKGIDRRVNHATRSYKASAAL